MSRLDEVRRCIEQHASEILGEFKPGMKITVLVRNPQRPDGSQNVMITNDAIDDIAQAVEISRSQPERRPA